MRFVDVHLHQKQEKSRVLAVHLAMAQSFTSVDVCSTKQLGLESPPPLDAIYQARTSASIAQPVQESTRP